MPKKETKTDTSSGKALAILANPNERSLTAWESIVGVLNPPLDMLGRKRKDYIPAIDDLKPSDDQGDGKDAYGREIIIDAGHPTQETEMAAKTGEVDKKIRRIAMIRDHKLEIPELNLRVALLGPPIDTRGFPALFARANCLGASDIYDADIAVFTGGPDVDPAYYGENRHPSYYGDDERDYNDMSAYLECEREGIPMVGVCRGAQFLAVMNGGKLAQDLDEHVGEHPMWLTKDKYLMERVSSVHHQAVLPMMGMEILGQSFKSTHRWLNDTVKEHRVGGAGSYHMDIEAFFIRDTCCFGVQGHPEYAGFHAFSNWFLKQIDELIICNPDLDFNKEGLRRIKPDILTQRELQKQEEREKKLDKEKKKNKDLIQIPSEAPIQAQGE